MSVYDGQAGIVRFLYERPLGRRLAGLLVRPRVSRAAGWLLDRWPSRLLVGPFIRRNRVPMEDYPARRYRSFNDFFTRRIRPERRPIDGARDHLIAPCDGKLTAYPLTDGAVFSVKGTEYTLEQLLRDRDLAEIYEGGTLLLFRLTVDDYHRYCYAAGGRAGPISHIPGVYHTVHPRAAAARPIYRENTREYQSLETEEFGRVLMMEVGALLVGRIHNHRGAGEVRRGEEKGFFAYGGSTVILLLERGRVRVDGDIWNNARAGEETLVKMGERIGTAEKPSGTGI